MLSTVYAKFNLCLVPFMLSVASKHFTLSVVILNVDMLNVVMLSVVMLNVVVWV